MSLTYAGVRLVVPSREVLEWVRDHTAIEDLSLFSDRDPSFGDRAAWGLPPSFPTRPVEVGTLFWPNGALRFSVGYLLATDRQLTRIKQEVWGTGTYRARDLVLSTRNQKVTVSLYLLPPRPLTFNHETVPVNGLYLLTLVDARYFWWVKSTGALTVTPGTTTWANLYTSAGSALGITLSTDTVNTKYLKPSNTLEASYEPAAPFVESLTRHTGLRLVANLDGTFRASDFTRARDLTTQNIRDHNRSVTSGGYSLGRRGGRVPNPNNQARDLDSVLPSSVQFVFPRLNGGVPSGGVYTVTKTLTTLRPSGLEAVKGNGTTWAVRSQTAATFNTSGDSTPTNDTELQDLVSQWATDWYLWQSSGVDVRLAGIRAWIPDALHDVTWTYRKDEVHTRVSRGPLDDPAEGLATGNSSGTTGGDIITENVTYLDNTVTYVGGNVYYQARTDFSYYSTYYYNPVTISTGTTHNYNPGNYPGLYITPSGGPVTLTGIQGGTPGRILEIINRGTYPVYLPYENTGSTTTNRIYTPTGLTFVIPAGGRAQLIYLEAGTSRWLAQLVSSPYLNYSPKTENVTTNVTNYTIGQNAILRLVPDNNWTLGGFTDGTDGRVLWVINGSTTNRLEVLHEDGTATAANRVLWSGADSVYLGPGSVTPFVYDGTDSRWRAHTPSPGKIKGDLEVWNGTRILRFGSGTNGQILQANATTASGLAWADAPNGIQEGRLELTGGFTKVNLGPWDGNRIALYDGTTVSLYTIPDAGVEATLPATTNTIYDIFAYVSAGAPALEFLAWSNSGAGTSARATALVRNNGVWSKTGVLTRRFLGSVMTTGTSGTTDPSVFWRLHHRRLTGTGISVGGEDTHIYTTASWREYGGGSGVYVIGVLIGIIEELIEAYACGVAVNDTGIVRAAVGVGLNSSTTEMGGAIRSGVVGTQPSALTALQHGYPAVGYNNLYFVQKAEASGTTTWYGGNGGDMSISGFEVRWMA
jgi:hypothetical protein